MLYGKQVANGYSWNYTMSVQFKNTQSNTIQRLRAVGV